MQSSCDAFLWATMAKITAGRTEVIKLVWVRFRGRRWCTSISVRQKKLTVKFAFEECVDLYVKVTSQMMQKK